MSYSYERRQRRQNYGSSTRQSGWGHWLPLAITVTVAAAGIAAWVWKERNDDDEDDYPHGPPPPGYAPGPSTTGPPSSYGPPGSAPPSSYGPPPSTYSDVAPSGFGSNAPGQPPYASSAGTGPEMRDMEQETIVSRMSGALRRTPSPQQIIDGASRRVVAGVAAAGAAVGLSSIQEENKRDYEDHSRWSEEAESQSGGPSRKGPVTKDAEAASALRQSRAGAKGGKKKTVAIIVSAETDHVHDEDASYHQEEAASTLSLDNWSVCTDSNASRFYLTYRIM